MLEYISDNASIDGSAGLLAIVLKIGRETIEERAKKFFTEKDNPIQLGLLHYGINEEVPAHIHLPRTRRGFEETQEVLFIRKGCVSVSIYSPNGNLIKTVTLSEGDCILLMAGGHSLRTYSQSEIIEVKLGPYTGRENDKIDFPIE